MTITEAMPLSSVAQHCREESARPPQQRQSAYCFELFRRAIVERNQEAWAALYAQYFHLVRHWLGDVADPDNLAQEAFERFFRAVGAERFESFPNLNALLAYLRCIAVSLHINEDRRRAHERRAMGTWLSSGSADPAPDGPPLPADQELAGHIYGLLQGERERLVFDLTYQFDLAPREIARRHPAVFASVDEVYRIKERIKKRLQRDPQLRSYLKP